MNKFFIRYKLLRSVFLILMLGLPHTALSESAEIASHLRLRTDSQSKEPTALESAIVSISSSDSRGDFTFDLISAIHIADKKYFEALNQKFRSYDYLLYELVAAKEDLQYLDKLKQDSTGSNVSLFQNSLAGFLDLSFQLQEIDYTAKNFVHADMSPELLEQDMNDRGESFQGIILKAFAKSAELKGQTVPADLSDIFLLFTGKHSSTGLKRIVARQFNDMDQFLEALNGKNGLSIIHGRNAVALDKLDQLLKGREKQSRYAIFYGAAHMPDLYKQFTAKWPVKSIKTEWLKAWDLSIDKNKK